MAFYSQSPFAQMAADPLAAAFPSAACTAVCATVDCDMGVSSPGQLHVNNGNSTLTKKALGRASFGGPVCYSRTCQEEKQEYQRLLHHTSLPPFRDLDALMEAAARKPGYFRNADESQASVPSFTAAPAAAVRAASTVLPSPAVTHVLQQRNARSIQEGSAAGIAQAALDLIAGSTLSDTFYVYDLGEVARLFATWRETMPRVAPFYAVKCNPEPTMVAMLAALGAGFDCASIQELQLAEAHGVPQSRVIFANPCKRPADFRYAAEHGVQVTTFDCASELEKIAAGYPSFKCVLRIRCDDASAKINLGLKYGADMSDVPMLLAMAKDLGLQVVGVSFHVGSGCQNVGVYADAIAAARQAFDMAAGYGFNMELLDIGGGFTAPYDEATARLFYTTAGVINAALEAHFPDGCGVRIIAEPGRYFAETSATLFTTILGQREGVDQLGGPFMDYWLSDGTYGSFRIQVAVDGLEPTYSVLRSPLLPHVADEGSVPVLPCRLWGNSDRDGDVVHKAALLPQLRVGDWLMFPFAGAYTICAASNYGGVCFTQPLKHFIYSGSVQRDTAGFDAAAGAAAAAAAVTIAHGGAAGDGSCCGSDADDACGSAVVAVSSSVDIHGSSSGDAGGDFSGCGCDSEETGEQGDSCSGFVSHQLDGSTCGGAVVSLLCGPECSYLCGCGACDGAPAAAAVAEDACMSAASEGTAAEVLGGGETGDGQAGAEAEVTSLACV